jgi:hypothetical protein
MPSTRRIAVGIGLGLSLALVAGSLGRSSLAQAPGGPVSGGVARMIGTPGGVNPIMLMISPAVQDELKLTDEQKTKIFDLAREASRKGRERMMAALQGGIGNPRAFMAAGAQLRQENERAAAQILNPEQKERASQIMLQVEGPLAVARPDVASKLNLSDEQNQQVQMTMMQVMQAMRQMAAGGGFGGNDGFAGPAPGGTSRSEGAQIRNAAGQQIGRILNAKQKTVFKKMLGEPFDLSKIDPELPRLPSAPTEGDEPAKTAKSKARRKAAPAAKGAPAKDKDAGDEAKARP